MNMKPAAFLCGVCVWLATTVAGADVSGFRLEADRLIVTAGDLELVLQQGAVVALRDRGTGESFMQGPGTEQIRAVPTGVATTNTGWAFRQRWYKDGPAGCAADEKLQAAQRRPAAGAVPAFKRLSATEAEVAYAGLTGGDDGDAIRYRITTDAAMQEVLIRGDVRLTDPEVRPQSLDLAFAGLKCPAVILGCGTKIGAAMPMRRVDYCVRPANNLYSPTVAVLEGRQGVATVSVDSPFDNMNVYLAHEPEADDAVVVAAGVDPRFEPGVIRITPVRVGLGASWCAAARRCRERFEALTGAKPLWEQTPRWVRKIHAVHTGAPGGAHGNPTSEQARAYYGKLAGTVDPAALLLFYWNGNGIVVGADHRYMTRLGWPKPHVVQALKAHGFRWLGYHHYTLLFPPHAIPERYKRIEEQNWGMPEGYVFTPDYGGPPEKFHDHFRPVSAGYYKPMDEATLWVFHPGTQTGREFFIRNFGNYCRFHNMDGNYLDICGTDGGYHFPDARKILGGMTYRMGEHRMLRECRQALPDFALMSEVQSGWSVAHTFYTWEGASHIMRPRQYASIDVINNHPLRTALWGAYCWTRENEIAPDESALIGGLPELHLEDPWSIARARLFAEEELFHDLPAIWDPEAVAYYRGKGGRWFQFRRMLYGDAFVELPGARSAARGARNTGEGRGLKLRLGRFSGVAQSPLGRPVTLPGWQAYRDGSPLGLNPKRTYPFLVQPPEEQGDYVLKNLPAGVFVRAFRNAPKSWSTVEFGAGETPNRGEVTIRFQRDCLRVCDAEGERAGPFKAGSEATFATRVPGGLVLVWDEPKAGYGHARNAFLAARGKLDARGVHDPRWCQRSHCRVVKQTIGETERAALEVGSGRHRGYVESWVTLRPGGDPVLRFDVGYPAAGGNRRIRAHAFSVLVNGREIWREVVEAGKTWLPRNVALGVFRGRTVLLTLSVEEVTDRNALPSHTDPPSLFGNVYVDCNPVSFAPLDGAALPRPAEVLFTDFLEAEAIDGAWRVFSSPANQEQRLTPTVANGMLSLPGMHYKHQYLARPLAVTNPVVQARLRTPLTGCSRAWNPGIGLYWGKGRYAYMTAGGYHDRTTGFAIRGLGQRTIELVERTMRILDDNSCDAWVRIEVSDTTIRYASSLDGKAWRTECEAPRPEDARGPPRLLIVGRGSEGEGDVFQNDLHHKSLSSRPARIGELVVGR